LGYVLLAAAALYTHFYSGFVLLAFNVAFLIAQVRPLSGCRQSTGQVIGWLCAQIAVLVLFAPWMPVVASQLEGNATYWHGAVDWVQIVGQTLRAFSVGETLDDAWVAGATGVMSLSVLLGAVALSRHQRGRWSALLLWLWMLIPTAILVLLNRSRPKFSPRYLMNALPAFLLLVSVGALWLFRTVRGSAFTFRGWVALAALLVTVAILGGATARSLANLYSDAETYRPDFRAVAEYIETHASGDDVIVLLGGHSYPAFTYYYRGPLPVLPVPKRLLPTTREPIDIRAFAALNDASAGKSRLWLVLWQASLADPTGLVVDALEQTYRRLGVGQTFHEVALLCFDVSPGPLLPEGAVPQSPLVAELGGQVRFLGYDLPVRSAPPGGTLYLYLYWEALTRMEHDYKVFTQILDETGRIVAQQDRVAGAASYPTSHWEPGAVVRDRFLLTVQRDAAPGTYRLIVGMYDPSPAMPRLSVRGEGGEGDRIFLADIRVTDE